MDSDQAAIAAMTALIREGFYARDLPFHGGGPRSHERLARMAYDVADAMLEARLEHAPEALESASRLN